MKDHTSHDILLLCPNCHQLSNMTDLGVRNRLAHECAAPFTHAEGGAKSTENPRLRCVIGQITFMNKTLNLSVFFAGP